MAKPKKVVHVFGAMDIGGAELRSIELQSEMRSLGYEFVYVTLSTRSGELTSRIEQLGGRVVPIELDWRFPFRFVRLLQRERPVAIDSPVATFSGFICLLARLANVPRRIAHFHSDGDGKKDTWARRFQRLVMTMLINRFATSVVGVSPSALHNGFGRTTSARPPCLVVPNGTSVRALWAGPTHPIQDRIGAGPSAKILMHVGRPSVEKNRKRIPGILACLAARGLDVHAVLIGPRDERDDASVSEAAAALGVGDRLHLLGPVEDVGAYLRSADALVLPSTREGLPGVVVEAAAVGTPVVSSTVDGAIWLAEHLPGIECIPLDASDEKWADTISQHLLAEKNRHSARLAVESSRFAMISTVVAHQKLYGETATFDPPSVEAPMLVVTTEARLQRGPDRRIRSAATSSAYETWAELRRISPTVTVMARVEPVNHQLGHLVEGEGVRIHAIRNYTGLWGTLVSFPATYKSCRLLLRQHDSAILLRLPSIVGTVLHFAAYRRGRQYAVELIGDPFDVMRSGIVHPLAGRPASWIFLWLVRWQCAHASVINYVTRKTLQSRYPAPRARVITNASDVALQATDFSEQRPTATRTSPVLVCVGTMTQPYKGHDVLMRACASMRDKDLEFSLHLIGDGSLAPKYRLLADQLGIGDRVHFFGQMPHRQVLSQLDQADIFVLPSRTEGLPRALVEAMARGLPAIASSVGGIPELLPPSCCVRPGDVDQLSDALERMILDVPYRSACAEVNKRTARQFEPGLLEKERSTFFRAVSSLVGMSE